ncbi:hypothetical protein GCM10008967_38090 [Bacillus carboniphilus]|uniref:DUF4367 domain-containing protein n=1 Tax=Bacillus carboniphilus TaxID=86663 RepID=A0ABN0WQL8_9BACI
MDKIEQRLKKTDKRRRFITYVIASLFIITILFNFVKLPVTMAGWFVPFKVDTPTYLPLDVEHQYAKVVGLDTVKILYKGSGGTITVWATTNIGWNNVSTWDEQVSLLDGTTAYYDFIDNMQMISWKKGNVEYAVDYQGEPLLAREELIEIASSIK